jgi:microcystin-dependent protein
MTDPFLAEVRPCGFTFAPRGWALCNGQLMSIAQNTALFSLLGTTFGGDGRVTFGLPNFMQGRAPLGSGQGPGLSPRTLGETGGLPAVTLIPAETAAHGHTWSASSTVANVSAPAPTVSLARSKGTMAYAPANAPYTPLDPGAVSMAPGSGQPHNNLMPYQVITYVIALQGIFPQRP